MKIVAKWMVVIGSLALLLLGGLAAFILIRVPLDPKLSYVQSTDNNIAQVNWTIKLLRPVHLWTYERNGLLYYMGVYWNEEHKLQLVRVLVSGTVDGNITVNHTLLQPKNGKAVVPASTQAYKKVAHFGRRIEIAYADSQQNYAGFTAYRYNFCEPSPQLCVTGDYEMKYPEKGTIKTIIPLQINELNDD